MNAALPTPRYQLQSRAIATNGACAMRRGLLLAIVLVLGSAGAGLAAPHPKDTVRHVCELGHPCHHCPAGTWYCPSLGKCIPKNQGCKLL
jgi:hypothetical protein